MSTEKKVAYANLFQDAFREASAFLKTKGEFEKRANRTNLDSGIPLEDYFRSTFGRFIAGEYGVDCGSIIDRNYVTCGDCDVIIFSPWYAPLLKLPAADGSRRKFFPNEATYGIVEVKQTLTEESLAKACSKIHDYKSLDRELVSREQVLPGLLPPFIKKHDPFNRPFGVAFFYDCDLDVKGDKAQDVLRDSLWDIECTVPVELRVNGLYVLDHFAIQWVEEAEDGGKKRHIIVRPEETRQPILSFTGSAADTLYLMFADVWDMLLAMHLRPPNFHMEYGGREHLQSFRSRVEYYK